MRDTNTRVCPFLPHPFCTPRYPIHRRAELAKIEKQIRGIIEAIKAGMFHESMKAEMDTLEARKSELNTLLADAPEDIPDILPSASAIYAKKVSALTKALNRKEERQEAAGTLRGLIEKISLTPGSELGKIYATLHGELGTIPNWTERQGIEKAAKTTKPVADATGWSLLVVAGGTIRTRFDSCCHLLLSLPPIRTSHSSFSICSSQTTFTSSSKCAVRSPSQTSASSLISKCFEYRALT